MAEDNDEDLFADLYEGDDNIDQPAPSADAAAPTNAQPQQSEGFTQASAAPPEPQPPASAIVSSNVDVDNEPHAYGDHIYDNSNGQLDMHMQSDNTPHVTTEHGFTGTVGIKEDGKMFIGGLNWETTDQSLRNYFEQFGEVQECTVMRDGATGRSRGFGFLTFKDPKTVNTVMVKEHQLDGKIIDPKRAIPRDEQEKTSKIFVGGVSQDATEKNFEDFFGQFGRVIDATLMMDKDTGRPRGFGFVTFEGEAAVEATLARPLEILGKPIEVKRAQPRGNIRDENEDNGRGKFGRRGNDRFGRGQDSQMGNADNGQGQQQQQQQQMNAAAQNNMSPQMMAQYWQRMQQYFAMMQANIAQNQGMGGGMGGNMNMQGNPMMQQMMAMQNRQNGSPAPQSPGGGNNQNMGGMTPQMMQQMQMQQMQQMQQQAQAQGGFPRMMSPMGGESQGGGSNGGTPQGGAAAPRPGYNAQEQLMFEQRKYEQQQARRMGSQGYGGGSQSSWEGMYDDVPQPNHGGGHGRGGNRSHRQQPYPTPQPAGQAPANAPTGPKNAGKPGANYRGGGQRGGHARAHPYGR